MRVRSQKLIHWSEKHTKKTKFTKKFFERASLKSGIPEMCHHNSRNPEMGQLKSGIPEMCYHKLRIPEMCQLKSGNTFQKFLIWAATFRKFSICGSSFQEFLIWGWHISGILDLRWHISGIPDLRLALLWKLFRKLRFFGMFWTSMNQFLASNSHLFRWHVYFAKKLVKNAQSCVK